MKNPNNFVPSKPPVPPPFYEKFVPLAKCEAEPKPEEKSKNLYIKGTFFYDNSEDNPEYDYTWGFVRVE